MVHNYSVSVNELPIIRIILQPFGVINTSHLFEIDISRPVNSCVRFPILGAEFVDVFNVKFVKSDSFNWSLSYEGDGLKFDPKKYF